MMLTLLGWGVLADRIGEHRVIPLGLVGTALAVLVASGAAGYATLLPCLLVAGLFVASTNAASGRAVMGWFARGERGLALGVRQASLPLGAAVAAAALPAVAAAGGADAVFVALAALLGVAALVSVAGLRAPPVEQDADVPADRPSPLRDARVWRLSVASGLLAFVQFGFVGFLVLYLHDQRGWSPAAAAGALVAVQLAGVVLRIAVGRWSDRHGTRVGFMRWICGALFVSVGTLALVEPAPEVVLLPVLALAAFVSVSWNGLSFAATAELAQRGASGTALGLQNTVLAVSGTLCLASFGALVAATSWRLGFGVLALLPAVSLVLLPRGRRRSAA
jgi:sugar phosphate permease